MGRMAWRANVEIKNSEGKSRRGKEGIVWWERKGWEGERNIIDGKTRWDGCDGKGRDGNVKNLKVLKWWEGKKEWVCDGKGRDGNDKSLMGFNWWEKRRLGGLWRGREMILKGKVWWERKGEKKGLKGRIKGLMGLKWWENWRIFRRALQLTLRYKRKWIWTSNLMGNVSKLKGLMGKMGRKLERPWRGLETCEGKRKGCEGMKDVKGL